MWPRTGPDRMMELSLLKFPLQHDGLTSDRTHSLYRVNVREQQQMGRFWLLTASVLQ